MLGHCPGWAPVNCDHGPWRVADVSQVMPQHILAGAQESERCGCLILEAEGLVGMSLEHLVLGDPGAKEQFIYKP